MATVQQPVAGFSWDTAVDLSKKENRTRLSPAAIKGLFRIAAHWKLRDEDTRELLGGISGGSFYALKGRTAKTLNTDQLTRISLLIGIYKALNIYFNKPLADRWITFGNRGPMFAGASPLDYMIQNGLPGMLDVRRMLDAWRGGV